MGLFIQMSASFDVPDKTRIYEVWWKNLGDTFAFTTRKP
jgi:hypothetical protein